MIIFFSFIKLYNLEFNSILIIIYKQNNYWFLEDNGFEQTKVYVNNQRIKKTTLKLGDVIFTNGLKIIWMDSFIRLNNPNNKIKTTLKTRKIYQDQDNNENILTPVKDTEKSIVLYTDNQVFFHTPRAL